MNYGNSISTKDNTEQKESKNALEKEKEFSDRIIQTADAVVVGLDKDHIIQIFSNGAERITGYGRDEVIGKDWFKMFFKPEMLDEMNRVWDNAWGTDNHSYINPIFDMKGEEKIISWSNTSIDDEDGNSALLMCIGQDITERQKADEKLRKSEEKYRTLVQNLPQRIFIKDYNLVYTSCNESFANDIGINSDEIAGKTDYDFFSDKLADKYRADDKRVMETGITENIEERYIRDEKEIWVSTSKTPLKDEQGNVIGILGIFWDITERKVAEQELKESKVDLNNTLSELEAIIDALPGMVAVVDLEFNTLIANTAVINKFGHSNKEEVLGKKCYKVRKGLDDICPQCGIARTFETGELVTRISTPEEEKLMGISTKAYAIPLKDEEGNIWGGVEVIMDVTDLKQKEEALQKNEYYLSKAQEIGLIGTWELDLVNNVLIWTDETYRIFGVPLGTPINYEIFLNCIHPDDRDYVNEKWAKGMKNNDYDIEHRLIVDGQVRWVREKAEISYGSNGELVKAIGFSQDITERKKAELELRLTLNATTDGIWSWNFITDELKFSPRYYQMLGYEPDEFPPNFETWKSLIHPDDLEGAISRAEEYLKNKPDIYENEFRLRRKDGNYRCIRATARVIERNEIGEAIRMIGNHEDITERKKMEETVRDSERYINSIFRSAPTGIGVVTDRILTQVNPRFCKMMGYTEEELIGKESRILYPSDEEFEFVGKEKYDQISEKGTGTVETKLKHKDGHTIYVILSSTPLDINDLSKGVTFTALDITDRKMMELEAEIKNSELEKFCSLAVDRELKMVEFKKEINELLERLGEEKRYATLGAQKADDEV